MSKSLVFYNDATTPNPNKVVIILEELKVPYESKWVEMADVKKEEYLDVNPNGRLPSLHDPNTGVTVWESGAIIDYLVDNFDKEGKFHSTQPQQKYQERSWEHFQMSGQGPYFGQLAWFTFFHQEKNLTSVTDRYKNEIKRVLGVFERHFTKTGNEYLVGDKVSYVDLMFVTWNSLPPMLIPDLDWKTNYPKSYEWDQKLRARPAVKKVLDAMQEARAKKH